MLVLHFQLIFWIKFVSFCWSCFGNLGGLYTYFSCEQEFTTEQKTRTNKVFWPCLTRFVRLILFKSFSRRFTLFFFFFLIPYSLLMNHSEISWWRRLSRDHNRKRMRVCWVTRFCVLTITTFSTWERKASCVSLAQQWLLSSS